MASVTTSITVSFEPAEGDEDAQLSAEVDSRDDGLNGGDTSFEPGDSVYILVFKSSNVILDFAIPSAGSLSSAGSTNYEVLDYLLFANETEQSLPKPTSGSVTTKWVGSSLGGTTIVDGTLVKLSSPPDEPYVGVLEVDYTATPLVYRLDSPAEINGKDTFEIAVFFGGHTE